VGQLTAKEDRAVAMETAQKKLWLDCDCGIDDAIGLLMGLSDPASTLVGSSAVWGNADAKQVRFNTEDCRKGSHCPSPAGLKLQLPIP